MTLTWTRRLPSGLVVTPLLALGACAGTQVGNPQAPSCARLFEDPAAACTRARGEVEVGPDDDLAAALAGACPGDVVRVRGRHAGPAVVGPGVGLIGVDGAQIDALGGPAVCAAAGDTRVEGLSLHAEGSALVARGPGSVALSDLTVQFGVGAGVSIQTTSAALRRVAVIGGLDAAAAEMLRAPLDPTAIPAVGILVRGGAVTLEAVSVTGTAGAGVALGATEATWTGGRVSDYAGAGVLVEGGRLDAAELTVCGGLASTDAALGTQGVAATAGAVLATRDLHVERIAGLGLLQDSARGDHSGLRVMGARDGGVWVQGAGDVDADALRLSGAELRGNTRIGVYAHGSVGLALEDTVVADTLAAPAVDADLNPTTVSDGLQLVDLVGPLRLTRVALVNNARVGLFVDAPGGEGPAVVTVAVDITSAAPDALGVIVQGAAPAPDEGLEIAAPLAANDTAFIEAGGRLGSLPPVAPPGRVTEAGAGLVDTGGGLAARLWQDDATPR